MSKPRRHPGVSLLNAVAVVFASAWVWLDAALNDEPGERTPTTDAFMFTVCVAILLAGMMMANVFHRR